MGFQKLWLNPVPHLLLPACVHQDKYWRVLGLSKDLELFTIPVILCLQSGNNSTELSLLSRYSRPCLETPTGGTLIGRTEANFWVEHLDRLSQEDARETMLYARHNEPWSMEEEPLTIVCQRFTAGEIQNSPELVELWGTAGGFRKSDNCSKSAHWVSRESACTTLLSFALPNLMR